MAGRQDYETPQWVLTAIQDRFGIEFDVDVCADVDNRKCANYIDKDTDALAVEWYRAATHERNLVFWCNPPYSKVLPWVNCAYNNVAGTGDECWMLLKNDSSTGWYQRCIELADEMYLITGKRISFEIDGVPDRGNNFASMLVRFRNKDRRPARVYHWDIFATTAYNDREKV